MSSILVPIVATFFAVVTVIILWWVAYPFALRYYINSSNQDLAALSAANGSNGANGANGANAPNARHGSHGQPGLSSAPGVRGNDGTNGAAGPAGFTGLQGEVGEAGSDGPQGVPGYNVICVKEDLFNPNAKIVCYVNGKPIDNHIKDVQSSLETQFKAEQDRIAVRIDNSFRNAADRTKFKTVLRSLTYPTGTPVPSVNILDSLTKFDNFLTAWLAEFNTQNNTLRAATQAQTAIINTNQTRLTNLRAKKTADLTELDSNPIRLNRRTAIIDAALPTVFPTPTTRLTNALTDIKTDISVTFDSKVREFQTLVSTQTRIYNSTVSTVTQKNDARDEISQLNAEINFLKSMKEEVERKRLSDQKTVIDVYNLGNSAPSLAADIAALTTGFVIDNYDVYSPDTATTMKTNVDAAKVAIETARAAFDTAMEAFMDPYRTAN